MVQGIVLKTGDILITSKIEKIVQEDYNDPDLDIENPYKLKLSIANSVCMCPYLEEYTDQNIFSFRSDDIITMFSVKSYIEEEYIKNTQPEEQLSLEISVDGGEKE